MAERTIIVCDVCGKPATETVTIRSSRGNFVKDLCVDHVTELVGSARKPRPGRPKTLTASPDVASPRTVSPRRRGRPRTANATRKSTTRKSTTRKSRASRKKA